MSESASDAVRALPERGNVNAAELEPRLGAFGRLDAPASLPQARENGGREQNAVITLGAALAEELPRQIRLGRREQLVDPVVDLAEEPGALVGTHAGSMLL